MPVAKSKKFEVEILPAGRYLAVVIGVYEIGHQPPFKAGDRPNHQVILQFELHDRKSKKVILTKENRPATISEFCGLTIGRNKQNNKTRLRKIVESILDKELTEAECEKGYDVSELLDMVCEIKIEHRLNKAGEAVGNKIESINPSDASFAVELESQTYDLDVNHEIPDYVPKWIKRKIEASTEWTKKHGGVSAATAADDDDDEDDDDDDEPETKPAPAPAKAKRTAKAKPADDDGDIRF